MHVLRAPFSNALERVRRFNDYEAGELQQAASVSIWVRWVVVAAILFETSYRVDLWSMSHILNNLYILGILLVNAYAHHKIRSNRRVTQILLFGLSLTDLALISFSTSLSGGFESRYFALYYFGMAIFASVFPSPYLSLTWATSLAVVYTGVCLFVGPGLDFEEQDEKVLFYRVLPLYGIAILVSLITSFERNRRRLAAAREREMSRQRIELSQTIHDTTAQSAYMIGLGIERSLLIEDRSNPQLTETLEMTKDLSRSSMWTLRLAIDGGEIFRGRDLTGVLRMHADTFTSITSIRAKVMETGVEPQLSTVTRSLLFSIAHNALSNAFRHSQAGNVVIALEFLPEHLRMSVSDDGIGLPDDYAVRGHGFRNMREDADRMGGELGVESDGTGTTVWCVVPYGREGQQ